MPIFELSMVTSTIVSMSVEAIRVKTKRHETVIRVLQRLKLDPGDPPTNFDDIYVYTLVEYGVFKPEAILNFFRYKFVREAFRHSFYKSDPLILDREAEGIIHWNEETGKLGRIDYDPRREFAAFSAVFHQIVDRTRTPADVKRDHKLDDIIDRLDRLELSEIRTELAQLRLARAQRSSRNVKTLLPSEVAYVRELLEAMGYRITDEKAIRGDLYYLCDMKSGAEVHQEVVHFVGGKPVVNDIASLNDAVLSCSAEKGVLLTRQPLPPALLDLVYQRQHIKCYTLDEFTTRLADFVPYLQQLIEEYEASEIPRFYVPLTVKSVVDGEEVPEIFEPLESYLDTWLSQSGRNHLSILGEFGSGKTWFCQRYAYLAAKLYLSNPSRKRIPVLITLRDYSRAYNVEQLITDAIVNRFKVGLAAGYKTFAQLNQAGRLLLIFDGFDEMERRVSDYSTKSENFWELAKVVNPKSKVILTCRTPYFRHQSEEKETLLPRRGRISLAVGNEMINLHDRKGFEIIHLQDFTDEDIQLALQKRTPSEWEGAYKKIEDFADLLDLASRPVLLDIIIKTLPQIQNVGQINLATLYKTYMDTLLRQRWSQDTDYVPPEDRHAFMKELAWEMDQAGRETVPFSEFLERVMKHFNLKDDPLRAGFFERDVRTQSYLMRDDTGIYRFAHKSFLEYFVACKMTSVLSDAGQNVEQAIEFWKSRPLTPELKAFLVDMIDKSAPLWQLIEATRNVPLADVGYAGGNAATLLRLQDSSFVQADLSQANLAGADLSNSDLTGVDMRGASLRQANLQGCTLVRADVRNADLTNVRLREMGSVEAVMFDPSGEFIASGSADGVVRLWQWKTGEQVGRFFGSSCVTSICFSPDAQWVLAGVGQHGHIKVWNRQSAQPAHTFLGHAGSVWDISFHPVQENRFASGGHDGSVRFWDLLSGKQLQVIHKQDRGIWDISYSADGAYIAVASGQELGIYDTQTGEQLWRLEQTSELRSVRYSSNNLLAYSTREGKNFVRDAVNREIICEMEGTPVGPNCIAFSPQGDLLAIGGSGAKAKIQIWDVRTGILITEAIACSNGYIGRMHWGPDGYLVSGSSEGVLRVWEVNKDKSTIQCIKELAAKMNCLKMRINGARSLDEPAPDGKGTLYDWFIARGAVD